MPTMFGHLVNYWQCWSSVSQTVTSITILFWHSGRHTPVDDLSGVWIVVFSGECCNHTTVGDVQHSPAWHTGWIGGFTQRVRHTPNPNVHVCPHTLIKIYNLIIQVQKWGNESLSKDSQVTASYYVFSHHDYFSGIMARRKSFNQVRWQNFNIKSEIRQDDVHENQDIMQVRNVQVNFWIIELDKMWIRMSESTTVACFVEGRFLAVLSLLSLFILLILSSLHQFLTYLVTYQSVSYQHWIIYRPNVDLRLYYY